MLHPEEPKKLCHVAGKLADTRGPVVAATDYIRMYAEQIRPFVTLDGRRFVTARRSGPASRPEELGRALAEELIAGGAAAILAGIRSAGTKP